MAAEVITVLALLAGISWLSIMVVSAFRNRGGEEVAPNLQPGIDDQQLETRRLERGQKFAIAGAAFLAVSLPLYFLGEPARQEGFVHEFDEASVERGASIAEEFGCFACHGPLGVGGSASFVERRSGVTVDWEAPALNDIFYRYSDEEVGYWITYGRGNTPMPAWGLAGGGPMNEHQVADVVNYLKTLQRPQDEVVAEAAARIQPELDRLATADAAVLDAITRQEQVVGEIDQAPEDNDFIRPRALEARRLLETTTGFDTDADGLPDVVETRLSEISVEVLEYFRGFQPVRLDPEVADADLLEEAVATVEAAALRDPILNIYVARINAAIAAAEGDDTDGDGLPDALETQLNALFEEAANSTVPASLAQQVTLSPTNPQSVTGTPDRRTATTFVGALESVSIITRVLVENEDRIRPQEEAGLEFLRRALEERAWEIDIQGVASLMGVSQDQAARAVGLFQANCARCHTASFSAGLPFAQEIGSGGFGPALWDARAVVQFGEAPEDDIFPDPLVEFLIGGSVAGAPYGLNGFGSGRMPGFGGALSLSDIELIATYLRSDNLKGVR